MMKEIDIIHMIYEAQKDCAPVTMQIGRVVNNVVYHGDIVIKECPPVIIRKLVEAGISLSLTKDGLVVYKL